MRTHRSATLVALFAFIAASFLVVLSNSPASAAATYKILVAGDSITHGSSGDYTWRYRLWSKLQSTAAGQVEFVGTRTDLFDHVNDSMGSQYYAANFAGKAHAAKWGSTYWQELDNIRSQVTSSGANTLVVMLGSNDLSFATSPAQTIENVRTYIATARDAKPGIDVVVGEVVNKYDPWTGAYYLNSEGADYASRLRTLATQLDTSSERVVVAATRTGWDAKDHTWDGTHPNPTGEALIAQRMSQALATIGIGTSGPDISGAKAWNVTAPAIGLEPAGHEAARLSWNRTSTGATGMYIEVRLTNINEPWNRLPYAIGGEGWTAELLAAGGTYQFRVVPAKGWNTGLSGPASTVTATGPTPGAIASITATAGGDDPTYGGKTAPVDWSASTNASGYYLSSRKMHNGTLSWDNLPYPVTATNWTFGVLYPGWRYQFGVTPIRGFLSGSKKTSGVVRMRGIAAGRAYVSLGDSYSSGLGAETKQSSYTGGDCKRTTKAWSYQLQADWMAAHAHYACAGAKVPGVRNQVDAMNTWFVGDNRGRPQLITLTVGGNDVGFAGVINQCVTGDCTSQESVISSKITDTQPTLQSLYSEIRAAQPYADIIVGGYPAVLEPSGASPNALCMVITGSEREMAGRLATRLNNAIATAASSAGVWSVGNSVKSQFAGHNACTYSNSDEWIHSADWDLGGEFYGAVSPNSFHPKVGGQLAYAIAFSDTIIARAQ